MARTSFSQLHMISSSTDALMFSMKTMQEELGKEGLEHPLQCGQPVIDVITVLRRHPIPS